MLFTRDGAKRFLHDVFFLKKLFDGFNHDVLGRAVIFEDFLYQYSAENVDVA